MKPRWFLPVYVESGAFVLVLSVLAAVAMWPQ